MFGIRAPTVFVYVMPGICRPVLGLYRVLKVCNCFQAFELSDDWKVDYASYKWIKLDPTAEDTKTQVNEVRHFCTKTHS